MPTFLGSHVKLPLVAALALAAVSSPIAAQRADTRTVASVVQKVSSAVVQLRVYDSAGRQIALGSGFILSDGRVATNSHVLEGGSQVEVIAADGDLLMSTQFAEALSTTADIAILPKVAQPPGMLTLSTALPSVGEHVIAFGAPEGLSNTVSDGIVSAVRSLPSGRILQITAPISSGSSGGPVVNLDGEVVGVSVAQLREGQNLNFAIPSTVVRALASSPVARFTFPAASVVEAGEPVATSSQPTSELHPLPAEPIQVHRHKHFELRLHGCLFIEQQFFCLLKVANVADNERANRHFYLDGADFFDQIGVKVEGDSAVLGAKQDRIKGWSEMLDDNVPRGNALLLAIRFPGVPQTASRGNLMVRVSVGFGGDNEEVWFRDVPVTR